MLSKELDIVKLLTRVKKTKILVDQRIKDPEERLKVNTSKKIVIGLEDSSSSDNENSKFTKEKSKLTVPFMELFQDPISSRLSKEINKSK